MDRMLILVAVVIIAVAIVSFSYKVLENLGYRPETKNYCSVDKDCVPEQCCHPYSCVNVNYKPNCAGIMCTQVCQGPIDCGAGSCKCVNNRCEVVP